MAIAAVPAYLGSDFSTASPGMRFGMFLKLWGVDSDSNKPLWKTHDIKRERRGEQRQQREVREDTKTAALKAATLLAPYDRKTLHALALRQRVPFERLPGTHAVALSAVSIAPFTTGLGNEHPLENGFSFLNPYGLPYLPGSSVKGVVRQAARELASGEWEHDDGWAESPDSSGPSVAEVLFGNDHAPDSGLHARGVLSFWDAVPRINANALTVEVMTPHQAHYYQRTETPHDSGQPNPIGFLTVPPGSRFTFHVTCEAARLANIAPGLAKNERWKDLLRAAFGHAFAWLGFGAKTAVGYGAMKPDRRAAEQAAARPAAEDAHRQEREAHEAETARRQQEDARRQAERDALPDSHKRRLDAEEALRRWQAHKLTEHRNRLESAVKALVELAPTWPEDDERELAATLVERIYDTIGWHVGRKPNKKQRERQTAKKRDAIARIRSGIRR